MSTPPNRNSPPITPISFQCILEELQIVQLPPEQKATPISVLRQHKPDIDATPQTRTLHICEPHAGHSFVEILGWMILLQFQRATKAGEDTKYAVQVQEDSRDLLVIFRICGC